MTDEELCKRPLDEEFDTMMEVERNPHGAWEAIQSQADRIEALRADLKSARIRIEIIQTVCRGLAEQLMKAHTEIAQAIGKAGGKG